MIRKLFPVILALLGLGTGVGGGMALRPTPDPATEPMTKTAEAEAEAEVDPENAPEYVKLNNQFVVPVLKDGRVTAMVILALSLEVAKDSTEAVYSREPKLRDAFLQVMFDHANAGGFQGSFTDGSNLILLRRALLEAAQSTIGDSVKDVLISDIARQDTAG
jgi:flagellar basal body-associated protein FliL